MSIALKEDTILVCPRCRLGLKREDNYFFCASCANKYPIVDGIPDFRKDDEYWCNVSREKMQRLNKLAKEKNDWAGAAREIVPEYMEHFQDFKRADAQFIWPVTPDMRILDAGSMWGGLTIPVAQYAKEVVALDKTLETLSFLNIRAGQMGYGNIYSVASTLEKLPFKDEYFDLVILNGVLEWVAFRQDLVLEKHWNHKSGSLKKYFRNPLAMQIEVLKELQRVTKPDGYLFLAIENRIGYQYLTGYPDDHVNIKFVTFLPRKLADIITKFQRGFNYRTYVYSSVGYDNILRESGYKQTKFYGAFTHYISPYAVIPFTLIKQCRKLICSGGGKRLKLFFKFLPSSLMKYFSPTFIIIAAKSKEGLAECRIIDIIKKTGVLKTDVSKVEPVLISRRSNTHTPLNCLIYAVERKKPVLFCKISRSKLHTDALKNEADNLAYANKLFKDSPIAERIPRLLYFGNIDGVSLLVTDYLNCDLYRLRKITGNRFLGLDNAVRAGIDFLVGFQHRSVIRTIEVSEYFPPRIKQQKGLLSSRLDDSTNKKIDELADQLTELKGVKLRLSAIHGDFDFYHNILHKDGKIYVVDFEHFEKEGMPFLDLAMLIFHPFLMEFKKCGKKDNFLSFLTKIGAMQLLKGWLAYYFLKSENDRRMLGYAIKIAVLEQNAKEYPYYRDRESFPLNNIEILKHIFNINFV